MRTLIEAVSEYLNSKVNVVAFSMGCAISRKALLGGRCVDTGEQLGYPLTGRVQTFLSLGGVAYGLGSCMPQWPACNLVNGMACASDYMVRGD